MSFWQLVPQGPLARHVDHLWASRRAALPHRLEWLLPSGCADLVIPLHDDAVLRAPAGRIVRLRGGVFQGAGLAATLRATGGAADVVGVHFRPGGAAALFGGAAIEAGGCSVALADFSGGFPGGFPGHWAGLRERLGDEPSPPRRLELLAQALEPAAQRAEGDPLVAAVLRALHRAPTPPRIEALRALSGLGVTRFVARFHAQVGLTPKRYARVLRFNRALDLLAAAPGSALSAVALATGHADQAHFANEFRRFAGVAPSAYAPAGADQPRHLPVPAAAE
ncbi:MAG: helix-turn-helix transcriptional regulator [Piscinibacter sp.]|nr:helix-turn-helix transcriptional regulator [Piscinibacter sp.]